VSGRTPKPTGLKVIEGNRGKRALSKGEPEPDVLLDTNPPAHLAERSAAVWREVAPMLRRMGVLTVADVIALEMLCDAVADYRHARAQLGDEFVTRSAKGSDMLNQWLVAKQLSSKRAEAFMGKFGMDPVARSKVLLDPQGDLFGKPQQPTGTARYFQ
jgi:P27 family predicted phage terminase small subunit